MAEMVEKADNMLAARVTWIGRDNALQEFDLVEGGLCVAWCRLDDLECDMAVQPGVVRAIEEQFHSDQIQTCGT